MLQNMVLAKVMFILMLILIISSSSCQMKLSIKNILNKVKAESFGFSFFIGVFVMISICIMQTSVQIFRFLCLLVARLFPVLFELHLIAFPATSFRVLSGSPYSLFVAFCFDLWLLSVDSSG